MLLIGNSASSGYSIDEYRAEMDAIRSASQGATKGAIWWSVGPILNNTNGLATMLANEYYQRPAATPKLIHAEDTIPTYPKVAMKEGVVQILSSEEGIRYWAVYRESVGGWEIDRLIPSQIKEFSLSQGTWAVSAIDRFGRESVGVVMEGKGQTDAGVDGQSPTYVSCVHTYGGEYVHGGCSPSYQCCDGKWSAKGTCGACVCEEPTGQVGCGM